LTTSVRPAGPRALPARPGNPDWSTLCRHSLTVRIRFCATNCPKRSGSTYS
jgi:hypothetical protein